MDIQDFCRDQARNFGVLADELAAHGCTDEADRCLARARRLAALNDVVAGVEQIDEHALFEALA